VAAWEADLNSKLSAKKFSFLALPTEFKGMIDQTNLEKNYAVAYETDLPINLGHIEFWQPKK
jgi:hypothetical protein